MYHTFYSYFIVLSGIYLLNNRRGRKFAIAIINGPLVDASPPILSLQGHHIVAAHLHRWQQKRAGKLFIAAKYVECKREMAVSLSMNYMELLLINQRLTN